MYIITSYVSVKSSYSSSFVDYNPCVPSAIAIVEAYGYRYSPNSQIVEAT